MKITKIIKNIKDYKYIIIFICLITLLSVCLVCFSKKRQATQELEIEEFSNPGEVYATGINQNGQLGLGVDSWGNNTNRNVFTKVNINNVKRSSGGEGHTMILKNNGEVYATGDNYSGQLGGLITEKTGIVIDDKILRFDGKTFTTNEIYEELRKRLD